jgi:hypothetical protein
MRATRSSWKCLPPPEATAPLGFDAVFTDAEAEQLMLGVVPERMEDKWFIYCEDGWLRFHRSWSGALIYALRLDGSPGGVRVVEAWVNRDPEQYAATDVAYDRALVRFLIDAFLLRKPGVRFPMPQDAAGAPDGVVQHALVGRAYPERGSGDR